MEEEKNGEDSTGGIKEWLQDNLRIIISIVIVIVIAGGIYSYSKRTQTPVSNEGIKEEQAAEEGATAEESGTITQGETGGQVQKKEEKTVAPKEQAAPAASSKETEGSFVETAGKGNGVTHLARTALANYLEKNPDSQLTPEHKIYIEDYLRKKVGFKGRVFVGTSVEFSKNLIQEAIGKSKQLNDNQLKNLQKYAVMVPSLS